MGMNSTTNRARIWETEKNDYLGRKIGTRVFIAARNTADALEVRNNMMAAERLSGARVAPIMKNRKFSSWHETYSQDAGYLWGLSTGWLVTGYEVL